MYEFRMDEFSVGDMVMICVGGQHGVIGYGSAFLCWGDVTSVENKSVVVKPSARWMQKEITFTYRKSGNFVAKGYGYRRTGMGPHLEVIPF